MKSLFFAIVILLVASASFSQPPTWAWAKTASGNGSIYSLARAPGGGMYAAGYFYGPLTLGNNTLNVTFGGGSDLFLAKYTSAGAVLWARQTVITATCSPTSIASDVSGNVYMCGNYTGVMILDTISLNADPVGNSGIFVSKFNSSGNVMWAKRAFSNNWHSSSSIVTDPNGNVYVSGRFKGGYLNFDGLTLTNSSPGSYSAYLVKYNNNGVLQWAKNTTGNTVPGDTYAGEIVCDANGNVYMVGAFESPSITFSNLTMLNNSVFVIKFDQNGNGLWAKQGLTADAAGSLSVVIDTNGDIVFAGGFRSATITFGAIVLNNILTAGFTENLFLAKYSPNGNLIWAKNKAHTYSRCLKTDGAGNYYISGVYRDSVFFGNNKLKHNSPWTPNIFLAKYDVNGMDFWGKDATVSPGFFGYSNYDVSALALSVEANDGIYLGGNFGCQAIQLDTIVLPNPQPNTSSLMLAKTDMKYVGIREGSFDRLNFRAFPNPFVSTVDLEMNERSANQVKVVVYDILGNKVFEDECSPGKIPLDLNHLAAGVYFAEVRQNDKQSMRVKLVKNK